MYYHCKPEIFHPENEKDKESNLWMHGQNKNNKENGIPKLKKPI